MEELPEASGPGTVVLEIGEDVGAAIVRTPASLDGAEIEIRPAGEPWAGRHVAVRPRHLASGVIHAALFEGLREGPYDVRLRASTSDEPLCSFLVEGGRVAHQELSLQGRRGPGGAGR
jgi:hypothetical protein